MVALFQPVLYNKLRTVEWVYTSASASEVAQYGNDNSNRWVAILAMAGGATTAYNLSATISGVSGTVIRTHSSGDGTGKAVGTAIIVGQPSGSSGTVTVTASSGSPPIRFYVLRVINYNLGTAVYANDSTGAGIPPWSNVNIPATGLTLGLITNDSSLGATTWTGLTSRIADNSTLLTGKITNAAWNTNMAANASATVNVTASDTNGLTSAVIATFNPS